MDELGGGDLCKLFLVILGVPGAKDLNGESGRKSISMCLNFLAKRMVHSYDFWPVSWFWPCFLALHFPACARKGRRALCSGMGGGLTRAKYSCTFLEVFRCNI